MKVLFTAEELGLDYEYIALDIFKGENKTPEYLAVHPLGKLPGLDDDGKTLFESNAICRYLARRNQSSLYAGDAMEKAIIDQWVDFSTLHIGRWLSVFFWQEIIKPNFFNGETDPDAIAEAQGFLDEQLPVIDKQLASSAYLAGYDLTLADIIAFSFIEISDATSVSIDSYPHIKNWYEQVKQRPAVARARQRLGN
jgi:glutathione S-transferase